MAAGLGNGNLLLATTNEPMFAARPNAVSQMAAFEEAKAMMQQSRQLAALSQLQQGGGPGAGLPGFAPVPKMPAQNGNGLVPGSMGLQAAAQQLQNLQGAQRLALGAAQAKPQVLNQVMLNQAAQMMQMNQAQLNQYSSQANANPAAFLQGNQMAAAAAANAQARAAQAQAQAQRVAAAMGMLQQQQQQGALNAAARPGMPSGMAAPNAQMLALQRAAASGQLVLQNGKPVLLQNGNTVAAQAAANKQTQLLHALQAQQKQMQALNQLKAISTHLQAQGQAQGGLQGLQQQAQQNNINTAALLKQLQLQDAMAKQDALARAASMQQVNNNALAELLLRQQQQQQLQARANATAMANGMTAAQVQSLTAQALLQARNQALATNGNNGQQMHNGMNGGMQLGMNAGAAEALLASLHNKQMAANNMAAMQQAQAAAAAAAAAAANNNDAGSNGGPASPNGSTSSAGSAHSAASKEQRRLALACVALQLARGGISVEQAINSGIMGGMSVTDVRFIVECYNAERERMRQTGSAPSVAGSEAEAAANSPRPHLGSQAPSPAGSVAGSHADIGDHGGVHNNGTPHMSRLAAARGDNGTPAASDTGSPRSHTTNGTHPGNPGEANGAGIGETGSGPGFNAFSYGFFGEPAPGAGEALEGGLLEELEPGADAPKNGLRSDMMGGMTADEQAWLQAAANANSQMWEGVPDEEGGESNDDLAARLANLDLGSGFF